MSFISNLRDSGRLGQAATTVVVLLGFGLVTVLIVAGILLYGIVNPAKTGGTLEEGKLLGRPIVLSFAVPRGSIDGWFYPGLRMAPTIILAHNYGASREELLTLATAFQENQYNVLVFDFSGHGSSKRTSTLGYRETRELLAAVRAVAARDDVDRNRFGIWGAGMGGYAALSVATMEPRVRAVAVDSAYERPEDLFNHLVRQSTLSQIPLASQFSRWGFALFRFNYRKDPPLTERVAKLGGIPKLFIQANESPEFAAATQKLFQSAPAPKEQVIVQKAKYATMMDDERRRYENDLLRFFLTNLPPGQSHR